jgi:tetratricopeptide (TPR) repeat protein
MKRKPEPPAVPPAPASAQVARISLFRPFLHANGLLAILVVGGAVAFGWWVARPGVHVVTPPEPENITKAELRKSVEDARRLILEQPQSVKSWSDYGMLLLAHKCYAEADICFAEASRLEPESAEWFYYRYMNSLRLNSDPDRHLEFLRQAEQRAASLPEESRLAVRLRLGELLLEREEIAEAETLYRAEWQKHPGNKRIALGLGRIAFRQGDKQQAVKYLTPLQETPAARQVTLMLAALSQQFKDRAAEALCAERLSVLGMDTDWPDPFYTRMYEYESPEIKAQNKIPRLIQQGSYRQAAELCVARLKDGPDFSLYLGAGVNFVRARDFERGLKMLRSAEQLEPDNPYGTFTIAESLLLWGTVERELNSSSPQAEAHWREAILAAQRTIQLKANHAQAFLVLGQAQLKLGQPEAALEAFQRGVDCRPELFALHYNLGLAHLQSASWFRPRHFLEAARCFENARQLEPANPLPGRMLESLGVH